MSPLLKKVCMLGAVGVGKTSLVRRFVESIFSERYQATVGVKIDRKAVTHRGQGVNLMLWDLQGESDAQSVRLEYLRGAAGFLIVADASRPETLETALALQQRAHAVAPGGACVLVLNKMDLVPLAQAPAPGEWDMPLVRTSALNGKGVEEAFRTLTDRMLAPALPAEEV